MEVLGYRQYTVLPQTEERSDSSLAMEETQRMVLEETEEPLNYTQATEVLQVLVASMALVAVSTSVEVSQEHLEELQDQLAMSFLL
jgi:hypothetical protein